MKEAIAAAESETVSSSNGKHQSDATDSNTTIHPITETIDESRSPTSASESKDEVLVNSENSENNSDEGFSPAVGKKGSKKSSKKVKLSQSNFIHPFIHSEYFCSTSVCPCPRSLRGG